MIGRKSLVGLIFNLKAPLQLLYSLVAAAQTSDLWKEATGMSMWTSMHSKNRFSYVGMLISFCCTVVEWKMDLWLTPILVALLVFFLTSYLIANWRDNYPPGPSRLPIFGNLHQVALAGSMAKFCQKYRQINGDVSDTCGNRIWGRSL